MSVIIGASLGFVATSIAPGSGHASKIAQRAERIDQLCESDRNAAACRGYDAGMVGDFRFVNKLANR